MPKRNEKGVTLIELVMAIIILSVVALATAAMIGGQIQGMAASGDVVSAGNLARREMERLYNIPYASIADGNASVSPYTVSWTVATVAGGGGAERKDITMTVLRGGATLLTVYNSIAKDVTYAP
jgi:prepilin-type N-terminal cleavage/methylation domain-containing protein